jgi:Fic family protein
MGRLWQTLILTRWNPLFADISVESMIHRNQQAYYRALNQSTNQANCTPFIQFMLESIFKVINTEQVGEQAT